MKTYNAMSCFDPMVNKLMENLSHVLSTTPLIKNAVPGKGSLKLYEQITSDLFDKSGLFGIKNEVP